MTNPTQAQCPWCSLSCPTVLHRLWECPTITTYWDSVLAFIFKISKTLIWKNPLLCLFGCEPPSSTSSTAEPLNFPQWTHICLLVARRTFMSHWIKSTPPNLPAVKQAKFTLFYLERLDTIVLKFHSNSRFFARWLKYMEVTFTQKDLQGLMQPFRFTDWYLKRDLTNSLGNLKLSNLSDPSVFLPP